MRVLLSDGAGLTARQCATLLSRAGHEVEVLSAEPLCLCRFTRHVRRVHRVPACGADPFGWLDVALATAGRRGAELLLPVQEQAAVIALARDRVLGAGLRTAVPEFASLVQVQDKIAAFRTLARLGLPQPAASVAAGRAELEAAGPLPAFVKTPIGTASTGVRRVATVAELRRLAADYERAGVFAGGGVLVQRPVSGPLVMAQSVFARGEMIAFHACERIREGAGGGASHKRGLRLPEAASGIRRLGAALGWHGALSADLILTDGGPRFIDVNPRLVEPVNAHRSGVDLAGALVEVAALRPAASPVAEASLAGVRTHQLLLAVLGAASRGGRRGVVRELRDAAGHRGDYHASGEELTPLRGDATAITPVAVAAATTLAYPGAWRRFTNGSVGAYALTPAAWQRLLTAWREPALTRVSGPIMAISGHSGRGRSRPTRAPTLRIGQEVFR